MYLRIYSVMTLVRYLLEFTDNGNISVFCVKNMLLYRVYNMFDDMYYNYYTIYWVLRIINKVNVGLERWTLKHSVRFSRATLETPAVRALYPYRPYHHPYTYKSCSTGRSPVKTVDRFKSN